MASRNVGLTTVDITTVELINYENIAVDITKIFKSIKLVEHIGDTFITGSIQLTEEYSFREKFPFKGREKLRVVYSSGESTIRDITFDITRIAFTKDTQENQVRAILMEFASENYKTFLTKRYNKMYLESMTRNQIVQDICDFHGVDVTVLNQFDTTTINHFNMNKSSLKLLQEIAYKGDKPCVLYQRDDTLIFDSLIDMLSQKDYYQFTINPLNREDGKSDLFVLTDIKKSDTYDFFDVHYRDGQNGYKLYDFDTYNKTFTETDKKLSDNFSTKQKFEVDETNLINKKLNKNSKYCEDYTLMDFMEANIRYGVSDLMVGDLIGINLYSRPDSEELSFYSGKWLVWRIVSTITNDFKYDQQVVLVREKGLYELI